MTTDKDTFYSLGRRELVKNFIIMAVIIIIFKINIDTASSACVIASIIEYLIYLVYKRSANKPEVIDAVGDQTFLNLITVKTMLSSMMWMILAFMLMFIKYFNVAELVKNYIHIHGA